MSNNLDKIRESLNSIEFGFIKYINEETKNLGNMVLFFSFIIIILSTNFINIEELELNGIKISLKNQYLLYLLLLINAYYFFQFSFSLKIDNLNFKLPIIVEEIQTEFEEKVLEVHKYINNLEFEYDILEKELKSTKIEELNDVDLKDIIKIQNKTEELQKQSEVLKKNNEKFLEIKNELEIKKEYFNNTHDLLVDFNEKMNLSLKFISYNRFLNNYFPKMFFLISLLTFLYSKLF